MTQRTSQAQSPVDDAAPRAAVWLRAAAASSTAILLVAGMAGLAALIEVRHRGTLLHAEGEHLVSLEREFLSREIRSVRSDLLFLAEQPSLDSLLRGDEDAREKIEHEYLLFARAKPLYDQIRFLDASGQEIVRVNRRGDTVEAVPQSSLQSKASRYYFRQAIGLPAGDVFVSPLDLNVEHGQIEQPPKPVIRLATPVVDTEGVHRGLLVLNYAGARLLGELREVAGAARGQMMLVNRQGEYLQAPNPELEWGWLLGHSTSFRSDHPEAWERILRTERTQLTIGDALLTAQWVALDGNRSTAQNGVVIISRIPMSEARLRPGPGSILLALATLVTIGTLAFHWARASVTKRDHERHIAESEGRLRALSSSLLAAQEEERRSLSRTLHDELGQRVTAIALDLKSAAQRPHGDGRGPWLGRAIEKTEALLSSLHEIATRVRPSVLDDLGLADAIESFVADFQERTGVAVDVELGLPSRDLPASTAENAYRILQEALSNVAAHAGTDRARVRLIATPGELELCIEDGGSGFDPSELRKTTRLGMLGMRERAELLGGEFELESAPGQGTTIRVRLPIPGR